MRWFAFGSVGAGASAASVFTLGATRDVLVAIAAASAILLAYLAARTEARLTRSELRLEEAHQRILELRYDVDMTAVSAKSLHMLSERPIRDRMIEEDYKTYVEPLDRAVAAGWVRAKSLFTRSPSGSQAGD